MLTEYNELDSIRFENARLARFLNEIHSNLRSCVIQITLDYQLIIVVSESKIADFLISNLGWLATQIYFVFAITHFSIYLNQKLLQKSDLQSILKKKSFELLEPSMVVAESPTIVDLNGQPTTTTTDDNNLELMADQAVAAADPIGLLNQLVNRQLIEACKRNYPDSVILNIMRQRAPAVINEYFAGKVEELAPQALRSPDPNPASNDASGNISGDGNKTKNTDGIGLLSKRLKKFNPSQNQRARYSTHLKDALTLLAPNKPDEQESFLKEMIEGSDFGVRILEEIINRFPSDKQEIARRKLSDELASLKKNNSDIK